MSKKDKFWDLIDGALSEEERQALEQEIQADALLQKEQEQREMLHKGLQKMEAEQPSMRFALNIMDKLPQLYRRITVQPLVSKRTLQILVGTFAIFLVGYVGIAIQVLKNKPVGNTSYPLVSQLTAFINDTNNQTLNLILGLTAGFVLLFFLDRLLKNYFQKDQKLSSSKS